MVVCTSNNVWLKRGVMNAAKSQYGVTQTTKTRHTSTRSVEIRVVYAKEVFAVRRVHCVREFVVDVRQERVLGKVSLAVRRTPEVRDAQVLLRYCCVQQFRRELSGHPLEYRQVC